MPLVHKETHLIQRIGWLRAAVLGANDGILSTAILMVGVASASSDKGAVMVSGLAGLVAGAMSMAAGEYVSVSSQADTEAADVAKETAELKADPAGELAELAAIYQGRGPSVALALQVAQEMMAGDALAAHKRDELGIIAETAANPIQAGLVSAATFASGAALPLAVAGLLPESRLLVGVSKGWVTLSGDVHWHYQHDAAADAVRTLWGVTGVSNQIAIKPQANAANIKSDIMVALNRSWFSPEKIDVSAYDGKVTLTGTVDYWDERALAGTTAWAAPGVTSVTNDILVD